MSYCRESETTLPAALTDKIGRRYDVSMMEEGGILLIDVCYKFLRQRFHVGRSICNLHSNGDMELGDIIIFEPPMVFGWPVISSLLKHSHSFRRRGVGSELLRFIISEAQRRNITRIRGDIQGKDFLHTWYRENGFTVEGGSFYLEM
jgi:GNAT superfamily N-acetyltransferase